MFLIASHTYLGEDRTGTLRLWDDEGGFATPLEIKRRLDQALIAAKKNKKQGNQPRTAVGTLPAIPFEVVPPPKEN